MNDHCAACRCEIEERRGIGHYRSDWMDGHTAATRYELCEYCDSVIWGAVMEMIDTIGEVGHAD